MTKIKLSLTRKVSMTEIVSSKQSRAARRVIRKAAIESIKDQTNMSKHAREFGYTAN